MAEELRIVIQISEGGDGSGSGGSSGNATTTGGAGLQQYKGSGKGQGREDIFSNEFMQRKSRESLHTKGVSSVSGFRKQEGSYFKGRSVEFDTKDAQGNIIQTQRFSDKSQFVESGAAKRLKSGAVMLGIAAAREVIDISVSNYKYVSGDSFKNAQLDNMMKAANYAATVGFAAAIGGPVGAGVALAGIAVSEIGGAVQQSYQYNYDRRLEGMQLQNTKALVGNLTYGRPRGD